jgi:hypothetical protein
MITVTETKSEQAKVLLQVVKMRLNSLDQDKYNFELLQRDFDNCREQGYVLELYWVNDCWVGDNAIHVAFSENRNSDSIVVYVGENSYYPENISEDFWDNRKYFDYGQWLEAADYIIQTLVQRVESIEEAQ